MKKLILTLTAAALVAFAAMGTACGAKPEGAVNLVAVTAAEVGVRGDVDYFVIPEPAASTKVNALENLGFAGDLQELYPAENGYPQAVVVVKNELLSYVGDAFSTALKDSREWLLSDTTSAESIVSTVEAHLTEGMTPIFDAKNLTKSVIENCGINFTAASADKAEVTAFMQRINSVSATNFGTPADGFFAEDTNSGAQVYDGQISVYAPDGAPALGLAKMMSEGEDFYNGKVQFNIVNADLIQTFVTGTNPAADVCVLPVNLAVKLLGSGEKYKMLGTLTHGNLYMVSTTGKTITPRNMADLSGKTVGVVNLAAVPGLTFKVILDYYDLEFVELQ